MGGKKRATYSDGELILKPLQVEGEVRLGHLIVSPASQFSDNSRRHVNDEAIRAVEERQERPPNGLLASRSIIQEDINASAILLKSGI